MALFSAAAKGDFLKIQSLIDSEDKSEDSGRVDVNCSDASGHLEVVEFIVDEGADFEISDKDGFTALHIASFNGHLDIVKYLVSKGADLGRPGNDYLTPLHLALDGGHLDIADYLLTEGANINTCEDHYDYLRSTFGSKALPSLMPRPYSQPYDPYLTSPRHNSNSPRESIKEETKIISLDEYSIKVPLSPDDVDRAKNITAEALTTIPPDLKLEKDEVIISVGLKLSPPGLQFNTPVEVTISHSAIFTNPDKADIVLYTRRTESDEFSRIVLASDKAARCVVAKNRLTLYLDHVSEWWIISLIRRYFIGKRLICTPYVPLSTSRDVTNYIFLDIKDDFCGMKEVDLS
ncbi:ankyrin repeat and EF-hand domain-containing protein 1-like [Strongylocentrotus purpuratus]|uniref:ZU5 domain-containing protein n=1 Tax=Strongylocentrotus purpuratus TaxID=7668 RepID=A0A7M7NY15_STRPU|nr:ankyrin repeat and EF-hand domain-containing protein 1-like [Strongylocentrotus purpuratus]